MTLTLKYRQPGTPHQEKIRADFQTALRDKLRPDSDDNLSLWHCYRDQAAFIANLTNSLLEKGILSEDEAVKMLDFGQFPYWEKAE